MSGRKKNNKRRRLNEHRFEKILHRKTTFPYTSLLEEEEKKVENEKFGRAKNFPLLGDEKNFPSRQGA